MTALSGGGVCAFCSLLSFSYATQTFKQNREQEFHNQIIFLKAYNIFRKLSIKIVKIKISLVLK